MEKGNVEKMSETYSGTYDHGLGEAWAALAESKLTKGVWRASIHAPVPETPGWF